MTANKSLGRGDSNMDRLSSFLRSEGTLSVRSMKRLKPFVFYIETEEQESYIVKGNQSFSFVRQQQQFFEKLDIPFVYNYVPFTNNQIILQGFGLYWTLIPYIDGDLLHFEQEQDREDALGVVREFHQLTTGCQIEQPLLKLPLYIKWGHRLQKLQQTKGIMKKYGFKQLYDDVFSVSQERLASFASYDWGEIEKVSVQNWQWIHGDVAAHNFIRDRNGDVHLIDFDLVSLAPHLYDYIQLGQRFLPYLDWDLEHLLRSFSWLDQSVQPIWLTGLTIPSDFIREWWNFTLRQPTEAQYVAYLQQLEKEWEKRLQFVEQVKDMLT
ncbi:phosphotransferase [Aquibacillus sediminis]|uniref:phosphotransferase n=1 Tax=Aquibacillus sediminis TaxID=2574734 RepID=UPI001485DA53|nr:phosphotransferase [Aquibacillus sediminis]